MVYRIAVTSSDGKNIDLHFGRAEFFRILEVIGESWNFLESRAVEKPGEAGCGCHGHAAELAGRTAKIIHDCTYLLTAKIGPKPAELLRKHGITALEAPLDLALSVLKLNEYRKKQGKTGMAPELPNELRIAAAEEFGAAAGITPPREA
jgi:predicted Fe-Mo cluster-binding NifX family protein